VGYATSVQMYGRRTSVHMKNAYTRALLSARMTRRKNEEARWKLKKFNSSVLFSCYSTGDTTSWSEKIQ